MKMHNQTQRHRASFKGVEDDDDYGLPADWWWRWC